MNLDAPVDSKTTITPEVINTIVRFNALTVEGMSGFASQSTSMNRLFSNSPTDGMKVVVENNTVYIDLFVILKNDVNVRTVCRKIQNTVARAITEMVGMDIGRINIHVEDFESGSSPE